MGKEKKEKSFFVTLETEHPEAAAYLQGYLHALRDTAYMHETQTFGDMNRNKYIWMLTTTHKETIFTSPEIISAEALRIDLCATLEGGLSHYKHGAYSPPVPFKLTVKEASSGLEKKTRQ